MELYVIIGLLLLGLLIGNLWWRRASRLRSLPCPAMFAGVLEGSLMGQIMGTQTTLDRLGLQPGQQVLEIGPGPGRLLIPAARRVLPGGEVTGLDIQPGMVARLEARAKQAGVLNLTSVVGDATQMDFPSAHFDLIYLCTVLGEIPDRESTMHHIHTVLKPEGVLSITEIFPDPHFQSRATVRRLAEAAGFRLWEIQGSPLFYTANFIKSGGPPK